MCHPQVPWSPSTSTSSAPSKRSVSRTSCARSTAGSSIGSRPSSRPRSRAGTSTSRRAGSSNAVPASTRSARPGTSPTRRSGCCRATTDPALLHYRSGAFYAARAHLDGSVDPVRETLRSLTGSAADPMSGGRHKVFGHPRLHVLPQTSTIASHLPRAVGLGFALGLAKSLGRETPWPEDALVIAQLRRRLGQPLDGGRCASTRRRTSRTCTATARCCSSARTTASASARVRRGAGRPRCCSTSRASRTSTHRATTRSPCSRRPRRR